MARDDGRCNYCGRQTSAPRMFVWSDVIVCSDRCDTAMSLLLDGVPIENVIEQFPEGVSNRHGR